jgi:hypothetical protein
MRIVAGQIRLDKMIGDHNRFFIAASGPSE